MESCTDLKRRPDATLHTDIAKLSVLSAGMVVYFVTFAGTLSTHITIRRPNRNGGDADLLECTFVGFSGKLIIGRKNNLSDGREIHVMKTT